MIRAYIAFICVTLFSSIIAMEKSGWDRIHTDLEAEKRMQQLERASALAPVPAPQQQPADPYIKLLSLLEAFIVGGGRITSHQAGFIDFPNIEPGLPLRYSTQESLHLLERAYKEKANFPAGTDHYEKVRFKQRILGIPLDQATQQIIMGMSLDEKIRYQLQRSQCFGLLFAESEDEFHSRLAQEMSKARQRTDAFIEKGAINKEVVEHVCRERKIQKILPHIIIARFNLLQAIKNGTTGSINATSQCAAESPECFPPLEAQLARELPELIALYSKRADAEKE